MGRFFSNIVVFLLITTVSIIPAGAKAGSADDDQSYSFVREWRLETGTIGYEVGIATDPAGEYVYVTDNARHKILKFDSDGSLLLQWGQEGSSEGHFQYPTDVAVDSIGNVYVVEYSTARVQKFSGEGEFLMQWQIATQGDTRGEGIAIDTSTDEVYVSATGANRILRYSNDGVFIASIGQSGSTTTLSAPNDVALDSQGNVFVADSLNNRIIQFSTNGTSLAEWEKVDEYFDIWNPVSIAVDGGSIYVASSGIHELSKNGTYRGVIGVNTRGETEGGNALDIAIDSSNGFLYSVGEIQNGVVVAKYSLTEGGKLVSKWLPEDPANDSIGSLTAMEAGVDGALYIADNLYGRIHKYSNDGKFLKAWGMPGSRNGEFLGIADVALDSDGYLYALESDNRRVHKFSSDGQFVATWGGGDPDSADGRFYYPNSIAVDSEGRVFVSDIANQRISIFTADGTFLSNWNAEVPSPNTSDASFSQTGFYEARSLVIDTEDNIYMVDSHNFIEPPYTYGRVAKFSESRELIASWDSLGGEILSSGIPAMAVDTENNVYATYGSNNVLKFTGDGVAVAKWGFTEQDGGNSNQVSAITVDSSGVVYVADSLENRILVFAPEGSPALADRAPIITVPTGARVLVNATEQDSFFVNVSYDVTVTDDHDGPETIELSCTPPSGSQFPVGIDTTVECVATDSAGNSASKSFIVSVASPSSPQLQLPEFIEHYGLVSTWGSAIDVNELYLQAIAVAVDGNDNVYILSYNTNPVQKYDKNGTPLTSWGTIGTGEGQLGNPAGIAVDSIRDRVYVTDSGSNKVVVFTTKGEFVTEWGPSENEGQLSTPYGIAVDCDGFVYVADTGNQKIQKFTSEGKAIGGWSGGTSTNETEDEGFWYPRRMAIQNDVGSQLETFVYVTDPIAANIQKFTSDGIFVTSWSSGQDPEGIAVDQQTTKLYVADFVGIGIEKFDDSGKHLDTILDSADERDGSTLFVNPADIAIDSESSIYVVTSGPVLKFSASEAPTFAMFDMATNSEGIVYVLGQNVYMFDSYGTYVGDWRSSMESNIEFNGPVALAFDSSDNVLIASAGDYSIKKFTAQGEYILGWKTDDPLANPDIASPPSAIAVDSNDNVYVLD